MEFVPNAVFSSCKAVQGFAHLVPKTMYSLVQKKGTVLLSTSLAWPAVTGCSRAETFSQLSSISFAQLCTVFASNNSICMLEGCDGLLRWTSADTNPKYIPHTWKTVGDTPCNLCPEHDWGGGAQRAFLHQSSLHLLFLARSLSVSVECD